MVDFKSDATVTSPSWDVVKLLVLEKRENVLLSLEYYLKNKYRGELSGNELEDLRCRLSVLFYELRPWLKRKQGEDKVKQLENNILSSKEEFIIIGVLNELNDFLDKENLTKIDGRAVYDKMRVEVENERRKL